MLDAVGSAITSVLGWVGNVVTSLTTTGEDLNALLPLFAITVAVSAVMLSIKIIRGFVWGA